MSGPYTPPEARLSAGERVLFRLMSAVSEDCYAAGWMSGTEEAVWDLAHGRLSRWGLLDNRQLDPQMDEILWVAETIGKWIVWEDHETGLTAVPLAEWRERVGR